MFTTRLRSRFARLTVIELLVLAMLLTAIASLDGRGAGFFHMKRASYAGAAGRLVYSATQFDDSHLPTGIGLYTVAANGSDPVALTTPTDGVADSDAVVSPNGLKVAFIRTMPDGQSSLWLTDAGGSLFPQQLTPFNFRVVRTNTPTFSPDGSALLFSSFNDTSEHYELRTIKTDGSQSGISTLVHSSATTDMVTPAWSALGNIAWVEHLYDLGGALNAASGLFTTSSISFSDAHRIAAVVGSDGDMHPDWGPDGSKIAYLNQGGLTLGDVSGDFDPAIAGVTPKGAKLSWSPAGDKIAYIDGSASCVQTQCVNTVRVSDGQVQNLFNSSASPGVFGVDWGRAEAITAVTVTGPTGTVGATPTITGTAPAYTGSSPTLFVEVFAGSTAAGTPQRSGVATYLQDGTFTFPISPALPDGDYTARATLDSHFSDLDHFTVLAGTVAGVTVSTTQITGDQIADKVALFKAAVNRHGNAADTYLSFVWGLAGNAPNRSTESRKIDPIDNDVTVSTQIVGLDPGTQYAYQAVINDADGAEQGRGLVLTFTTTGTPPPDVLPKIGGQPLVGSVVVCDPGRRHDATAYHYAFFRKAIDGGETLVDETHRSYVVQPIDQDTDLECVADAVTPSGVVARTSTNTLRVPHHTDGAAFATIHTTMPNYLHGTDLCLGASRKRYCEVDDVRNSIVSKGFNLKLTTESVGMDHVPAAIQKSVKAGEVVAQSPAPGATVASAPDTPLNLTIQVYDPPAPVTPNCDLKQKVIDGARTFTMADELVGKGYGVAKDTLLEYGCYALNNDDEEINVKYEITDVVTKGILVPMVKQVSTERVNKINFVHIIMNVPRATLQIVPSASPEFGALTLGTPTQPSTPPRNPKPVAIVLTAAGTQHNVFNVKAPLPNNMAFGNTPIVLRDPKGQIIAFALTDPVTGVARFDVAIPKAGTYELNAIIEDPSGDGDVLIGYHPIVAIDRRGKSFMTLAGSTLKFTGGTWQPVLSTSAAAKAVAEPSEITALRAFARDVYNANEKFVAERGLGRLTQSQFCGLSAASVGMWGFGFDNQSLERTVASGVTFGNASLGGSGGFFTNPNIPLRGEVASYDGLAFYAQPRSLLTPPAGGMMVLETRGTTNCDGLTFNRDGSNSYTGASGAAPGTGLQLTTRLDANAITFGFGKVISNDGGALISNDGGGVISNDGGGLIGNDGATLIYKNGAPIVAAGGGNVISNAGGDIVAAGGGNIVAAGGGN